MNGFLYFLPGHGRAGFERVSAAGLGYAFATPAELLTREVTSGPGGQPGSMVARKVWAGRSGAEDFGYFPDRQTWTEPGQLGGKLDVGMVTARPPKPDDLVRAGNVIDGYWLDLPDGNRWLCPTARRFDQAAELFVCNLPKKLRWSDELDRMAPVGIDRRYRALWNLASRYFDAASQAVIDAPEDVNHNEPVSFEFAEADKLAMMALQTNYRVWHPEIELLELWDEQTRARIIAALLDDETWHNWIKKKLLAAGG